jgi:chromosome segregation ATPase
MLTLLLVSLYEFKQFLQIVLWIAIPGTIIAIAITTVLHYRRKKNLQEAGPEVDDHGRLLLSGSDMSQLPDWLASGNPENTSLLKKYEREIRRYKENYSTLEQDFRALEGKYTDLLNKAYHNDQSGNEAMDQMQQDIKTYKLKIAQLQQALDFREQNNEQENTGGHDPMELHDLRIKLAQFEEENTALKDKLEESQYMRDLLEEKKLQTDFLQQQLEQRIKSYHQLEKQVGNTSSELAQLRSAAEDYNRKEQALQEELLLLHQQQSSLQTVITEKQDAIAHLEQNIDREQQKTKELEGKLELSSQLFVRIYAELAKSFDAGIVSSENGHPPAILGPASTAN